MTISMSPAAETGTAIQGDGGELRNQRQEIYHHQIEQRKAPPPFPEPFVNHDGVSLAGRDAETSYHLLHQIGDWEQKKENPEQVETILASSLHIGGGSAGVVVRLDDDQACAKHHQEGEQSLLPAPAHDDAGVLLG